MGIKNGIYTEEGSAMTIDWQQVRIQAAISAMQGIAAQTGYISADDIAKKAISYADALVKELKGG